MKKMPLFGNRTVTWGRGGGLLANLRPKGDCKIPGWSHGSASQPLGEAESSSGVEAGGLGPPPLAPEHVQNVYRSGLALFMTHAEQEEELPPPPPVF